jgi:hypothetical protein
MNISNRDHCFPVFFTLCWKLCTSTHQFVQKKSVLCTHSQFSSGYITLLHMYVVNLSNFVTHCFHNGTISGEVLNVNVEYIVNFMANIECRNTKYDFSPVQLNDNLVGTKWSSGSSGDIKKKKSTHMGTEPPISSPQVVAPLIDPFRYLINSCIKNLCESGV